MAPESERAKEVVRYDYCSKCESAIAQIGHWEHLDKFMDDDHQAHSNEPTLTCSEVVERLAKCCVPFAEANGSSGRFGYKFDREKATAILHSWRERRVQELEELLARQTGHGIYGVQRLRKKIQRGSAGGVLPKLPAAAKF